MCFPSLTLSLLMYVALNTCFENQLANDLPRSLKFFIR